MYQDLSPSIVTYSGRSINLLDPQPELIDLKDIAHALAYLCRFNGHTRSFYSVADHSIRVAEQLPAPLRLAGLLHDATEAYLGDVIQPLKGLLPGYTVLEESMWQAIAKRFDLPLMLPAAVKFADRVLLATERRDLIVRSSCWDVCDGIEPLVDTIHPLTPEEAEDIFLRLFDRYTSDQFASAA
jgi:5'-deoxynucleotidase YfbR-like HD superfamily hydrolase